jgi:hypothetical protein
MQTLLSQTDRSRSTYCCRIRWSVHISVLDADNEATVVLGYWGRVCDVEPGRSEGGVMLQTQVEEVPTVGQWMSNWFTSRVPRVVNVRIDSGKVVSEPATGLALLRIIEEEEAEILSICTFLGQTVVDWLHSVLAVETLDLAEWISHYDRYVLGER